MGETRGNLQRLFEARAIAIVGASEKGMWTRLMVANHGIYGMDARLHLVNPRSPQVFGRATAPSCKAIDDSVDVAYIAVPRAATFEALQDVADAGIPNALILTSGYAEVGEAGRRDQDELVAFARDRGITLVGPNCLGYVNQARRTGITAMTPMTPLVPGGLAIVSQSGSTTIEIMNFAQQQAVGSCFAIALGNEAMVDCADVMEYLIDLPEAKCIVMFLETIRNPQAFVAAAARARASGKPIVLVKLGRNPLSSAVAQSHTGALVGDDRMFDAMCHRHGLIRVPTVEHAISTAYVVSKTGPLKKPGVAMVSISGGACGLIADLAADFGVQLPAFSEQTRTALAGVMSEYGAIHNPFDVTGAAVQNPGMYTDILRIIGSDPSVGLVAVVNTLPTSEENDRNPVLRQAILKGLQQAPVAGGIVSHCVRPVTDYARGVLERESVPFVVAGFEQALRAFANAAWWTERLRDAAQSRLVEQAGPVKESRPTSERATLEWLGAHGVPVIPTQLAKTVAEAVAAAKRMGGAVALKIASPDIAHKTEAGGVKLDVIGEAAVIAAYESILDSVRRHAPAARIDGVLVAPMRERGLELLVGTHRDPQWGPAILVGMGGIWTEALNDTAMRLLPVSCDEVKEMLHSLRTAALLKGFRGAPAADLDAVADAVVRIGKTALALGPSLQSLEVNPLSVNGARVEALDALAVWNTGANP